MTPMNREDKKRQTREALLQAARAEIVEHGIPAISIRRICEQAGFTQGAFYAHFENRNAMLEAVMIAHMQTSLSTFEKIIAQEDLDLEDALSLLADWLKSIKAQPEATMLTLELQMQAHRDVAFAKTYSRLRTDQHAVVAEGLAQLLERHNLTAKVSPREMAIGFSALWSGFALQGSDPHNPSIDGLLLTFTKALIGPAEKAGKA